jgi:uncharacterized protein (TIGR02996 family)
VAGNRIETAKSGRSKCVTCNEPIARGAVRLAEEYRDIGIPEPIDRFFHVRCAAAVHPELVASALQNVEIGVQIDRAELEARIAPALARAQEARTQKYLAHLAEKQATAKPMVVAVDDTTTELLDQLADHPDDRGTLAVVADQLQARGDVRGELIALQLATPSTALALEGDDDEETDHADLVSDADRRGRRVAELIAKLTIAVDSGDKIVWGVGFIRRLELLDKTGPRLAALAGIWTHPSMRVLSELRLTIPSPMDASFVARLAELAPRTLRRLEIAASPLVEIAKVVAALPRLEVLSLDGALAEDLAHPALRHVTIKGSHDLARLAPKRLPALADLVVRASWMAVGGLTELDTFAHAVSLLAAGKWLGKLASLSWIDGARPVTSDDAAALAQALGKKRLAKLDLTGTVVPLAVRDRLEKLTGELVAPLLDGEASFVEHTAKPEWGRGKILSRKDGKLEVQFPTPVGKKVFKADAPFLKMLA